METNSQPAPLSLIRFLEEAFSAVMESGLETPEGFLERFSPDALMTLLSDAPEKRAEVLAAALSLPANTAKRVGPETAGALLLAAYEAGDTPAAAILGAFKSEEVVCYLPPVPLWAFLTSGEWWQREKDDSARAAMTAILSALRAYLHWSDRELFADLSPAEVARSLPREVLDQYFEEALAAGIRRESLQPERIYGLMGSAQLVEGLGTPYVYQKIIQPFAGRAGLLPGVEAERPPDQGPETRAATPRARTSRPPKRKTGQGGTPSAAGGAQAAGEGAVSQNGERSEERNAEQGEEELSRQTIAGVAPPPQTVRRPSAAPGGLDEGWGSGESKR